MKTAILAMIAVVLLAQTQTTPRPRPAPKKSQPKAVERYDPDKLPPGEVACGREMPRAEDNCECMKHRIKAAEQAQAICEKASDRIERAHCMIANEACSIIPVDVDSAGHDQNGERMPAQCRRSCTKARCECCKS